LSAEPVFVVFDLLILANNRGFNEPQLIARYSFSSSTIARSYVAGAVFRTWILFLRKFIIVTILQVATVSTTTAKHMPETALCSVKVQFKVLKYACNQDLGCF
jgi:hypothetical protein